MRTKKVIKNSFYSLMQLALVYMINLLNRKILVMYLGAEYLGYGSLFADIFSIMSLANLGVKNIIAFNLYKAVAEKKNEEISLLISIYRKIYFYIGVFLTIAGIILIPALRFIIKENSLQWSYIYVIYLINLADLVCGYFGSYKHILFTANQEEYIYTKISSLVNCIALLLKFIVLLVTKNYLLYTLITPIQTIYINVVTLKKAKEKYPEIKVVNVAKNDIKKYGLFKEMANFAMNKISSIIYSGTDNIIISSFISITQVGVFSNYSLIKRALFQVVDKVFAALPASLGNKLYKESNIEKSKTLFYALDMFGFFIGSFVACCFFALVQGFIMLFFGNEYVLTGGTALMFALNIYMSCVNETVYYYRATLGHYDVDRNYMFYAAIFNLVISLVLVNILGITGILVGTNIGLLFMSFGRIRCIFGYIFKEEPFEYYKNHIFYFLLFCLEIVLIYSFIWKLPVSWLWLVIKGVICTAFLIIINLLIFKNTTSFLEIKKYAKTVKNIALK